MDDKDIKATLKKINENEIEMITDTVCNTYASQSLQDGDVEAMQYRLVIIKDRVSDRK